MHLAQSVRQTIHGKRKCAHWSISRPLDESRSPADNQTMTDQDKMVSDALRGSWVHRLLPEGLWPYAQLARWERPIGWKLLMWPCWWAAMLAASARVENGNVDRDTYLAVNFWQIAIWLALFTLGAFVMRGAGCTYNDLVDQDIDDKVARTRSRPLPSGRVTRKQAWIFLALQLLVGLVILLQFNATTIALGFASVITIVIYPFMKRITWWPQLFLGLAFSWGALVGWTAIIGELNLPPVLLYVGCIFWVIAYDTIYAHQDIEDDALVGVKSTARLFGGNTRQALVALYGVALVLWASAFYMAAVPWPAWIGLAWAALHLGWQVKTFELENPALSLRLFKSNSDLGWILFLGLLASIFTYHV
jgi:4-hydroxybenzoate polyprenyltransferase